ncbi:MAG: FtsX-like permease family protein, partial [Actinobacteria bacterium]|nr:FtsX-like permease family protein [Actinomycetota bacterium]
MSGGAVALGLFLLVYLSVAALAFRRPLLFRLAAREAVRQRGQSLLVVAGLMIGTAAIGASLIGIDSALDSAVGNAYRTWGQTDLLVTAPGRVPFDPAVADEVASDAGVGPLVDGVQAGLEAVGSVADLDRRQGESGIRIIGFDPASQDPFGPFELADGTLTLGDDLGEDGVILSRQLAERLEARPGDRLTVTVEGTGAGGTPAVVAGIARSVGPGSYGLRAAVFAPLPTAQRMAGIPGINVVRVSALGGLESGVEGGERAAPAVREVLERLGAGLRVDHVKREEVRLQRESLEWITSMLSGMSVLILTAGAALVVNLVLMLAEERRRRLGVLRALGLTRRGLIQLSVLEGALYSLAAAVVGTAVGIGAGRLVSERFARSFAEFSQGLIDFEWRFSLHRDTVLAAFAGGAVVTLLTVMLAALRTARMSIPAAIRDLPEPARARRSRWPRVVLVAGGAVLAAGGLASGDPGGRLVGGLAAILVAGALLRSRVSSRTHATVTGAAMAAWSAAMVSSVSGEVDPSVFFTVFTGAVIAAVFGLSIVASANLRLVERGAGLLGRVAGGLRATLRPPLAYLARRPLRTGLSTGVFAVVLAIVTMLAVFLSVFRPRYERDSLGFDVRVTSTASTEIELPAAVADDVLRVEEIATLGFVGRFESSFFKGRSIFLPLYPLTPEQVADPPVRVISRDQSFESDEAM